MSFPDLVDRLADVRSRIELARQRGGHAQRVEIVAVTKTHGIDAVQAAWQAGITKVGENKVQEAVPKMDAVAVGCEWHLIGHLQRNKAKQALRFALVHSVDSLRLAQALDRAAAAATTSQDVLVQVNTTGEASKGGFSLAELQFALDELRECAWLRIRGVMTMAPFDASEVVLRSAFGAARSARDMVRAAGFDASELSMGMSGDFEVAVEEGATLVRLGTILFGSRSL